MSTKTMVAPSARVKAKPDTAFGAAGTLSEAIAKYGAENVTDATLGVIKDDNGNFATMPTFEEVYRSLPGSELCDYAPIAGLEEFRRAAIDFALQGHMPKGATAASVATPGGSGAIHNVIYNYVEKGEKYMIPDWCWGPYREMGVECGKEYVHYKMFDENNKFAVDALKEQTAELLKTQDSVLTIFNTPAHNPSGYTMTVEDWKGITDFYRDCAKDESKRIIVLWDMAYTDYAGEADEVREFLKTFDNMPENMLLLVAFSMSKSFLVYGMRSGALIGISTSKAVVEEFDATNTYSSRATWSNGSRGAQKALAIILADPALKAKTDAERKVFRDMITNRAQIFVKEAEEIGLPILPYQAGFFITLPARDQFGLVTELKQDNLFTIPMDSGGVRLAMSAAPTRNLPGMASIVKKHFEAGHHQL